VGGIPLDIGGGVRYVGKRFADEGNTIILLPYALANFYASYHLTSQTLVTARVNNAFNKAYADWADIYYRRQVTLGEPRYFELSLVMKY
jgi:iron complex outermembrane receptor protein